MSASREDSSGRESRNPTPPPLQPSGRHCCIGITRFSEALRSRHVQPRCAGVHVVIQDVGSARSPPRRPPAERTEPEEPKQDPPVPQDWRFTCYGFSEWTSSATDGATTPRCRLGFRPPREMYQGGVEREHENSPVQSKQRHQPTVESTGDRGLTLPETLHAPKPEPPLDWERLQRRLETVRERWLNASQSLYLATGKTSTKILDRDWTRDADRLHASMNRTASRAATAATSAAEAVQRRIREFGNPD
jgi:hypothetical protein